MTREIMRQNAAQSTETARSVAQGEITAPANDSAASIASALERYIAEGQTPMMAQYHAIKDAHPGTLLLYRMGDFYELFYDDAVHASQILDITLTKRGKKGGNDVPMCGVPFHSCDPYIAKLIKFGNKVAICEQTETPDQAKARAKAEGRPTSKTLVHREVVRIMTGGTLTEDHLLNARDNNYLVALSYVSGAYALAWCELSTGRFEVQSVEIDTLLSSIERLSAQEILIADGLYSKNQNDAASDLAQFIVQNRPLMTIQPDHLFTFDHAQHQIKRALPDTPHAHFNDFKRAEIAAIGAIVAYIDITQKGTLPKLKTPQRINEAGFAQIDGATRRNLELMRTQSGEKKGSLLDVIDDTVSAGGGRLLQHWLSSPLTDPDAVNARLKRTAFLHDSTTLRTQLRELLNALPDMERALSRLSMGRGGPRDLCMIRDGLSGAESLRSELQASADSREALKDICSALAAHPQTSNLQDALTKALDTDPPALTRDGGFVRHGYHKRLDELLEIKTQSRKLIANLQTKYQQDTGIEKLKIAYNNVLGYFIEVNSKHGDKLMIGKDDAAQNSNPYIHRQTMANAMRFSTPQLAELERDISSAGDKALALELEIFEELRLQTIETADLIGTYAEALSTLDVTSSFAETAARRNYTCPVIDTSLAFDIQGGRHPVVEEALRAQNERFMPNNCTLQDHNKLWLLTGPNMAGKSTFLRQNALIAIMAQIGSFVPATSAHIGIVDKIFSRVGASDDLAKGQSTFMVEMVETGAILNGATDRSLVILDEIGRGTATFDGLSIAWACVEHLHDLNQCRGLFATHYHELTALQSRLDHISCHSMQVKEWDGDIVFLHSVGQGAADRSYGIHVAKLAGLPKVVTARAGEVLKTLESGEQSGRLTDLANDLPLFHAVTDDAGSTPGTQINSKLAEYVADLNPDSLTPREALDALYDITSLAKEVD